MRPAFLILLLSSVAGEAWGQIPVTDVANLVNNQLAHVQNIAKWVESITQLRTQIEKLEKQIDITDDIRRWTGDPKKAATTFVLEQLGQEHLMHDYRRAKYAVVRLERSLESLQRTMEGNVRALSDLDLDGGEVRRDPMVHRRYTMLDEKREAWIVAVKETEARERALQGELGKTLEAVKSAETDAEVQKLNAKVSTIHGQMAHLSGVRRDEMDEIVVQKIANDSRREQERIAAAELEARDNHLANQRVSEYLRTLKVRRGSDR